MSSAIIVLMQALNAVLRRAVVAVLLIALAPISTLAAPVNNGALNLVTSPAILPVTAKPGQTFTTEIRVKNTSAAPERLKLEVLKFGPGILDGQADIVAFEPTDTQKNWVRPSQNEFTAEPNVWQTVKLTISVPRDAGFGYYYAFKFARQNPGTAEENKSNIVGGSAVLMLLAINRPDAKRQAELVSISADKRMYEFLPAAISVKLRNSGNVHFAPSGNVFISKVGQPATETIATIPINSGGGYILPNSNRSYTAEWSDGWPHYEVQRQPNGQLAVDKEANPKKSLVWGQPDPSKLRFGEYRATVVMAYTDTQGRDVPVEGEVRFWVIPWRIIAVTLLVGLSLLFGFYAMIRSLVRMGRGGAKK